MPERTDREGEARAALERVERDSETLGTSTAARTAERLRGHFAGSDAIGSAEDGGTDRIELWGRRIGRGLSAVLAIALTWLLGFQLGWW